jgi:hypothetical protein
MVTIETVGFLDFAVRSYIVAVDCSSASSPRKQVENTSHPGSSERLFRSSSVNASHDLPERLKRLSQVDVCR